jgi:hypothetical protein
MQDRVDEPPIVRCPGCDQPMEAGERTSLKERLVDIRYVCAGCGMETKRTIADEVRSFLTQPICLMGADGGYI